MNATDIHAPRPGVPGQPPSPEKTTRIWARLEQAVLPSLSQALARWFDRMDDVLFNHAGTDHQTHGTHFEALRWLRVHRPAIERRFPALLKEGVQAFLVRRPAPVGPRAVPDPAPLSLLDNGSLEESLAIDGMVSRHLRLQGRATDGYLARLGQLAPNAGIRERWATGVEPWPWTPAHVAGAFRQTLEQEEGDTPLDTAVKVLLYKHWERDVLGVLGHDHLAALLEEEGLRAPHIVPRVINPDAARSGPAPGAASPVSLEGTAGFEMVAPRIPPPADRAPRQDMAQAQSVLQEAWQHADWIHLVELLRRSRPPLHERSVADQQETGLVLHALHHLGQVRESGDTAGGSPVLPASRLKHQISEQLRQWGGEGLHLHEHDEMTLDMAAWLFEYIWQDPALSSKIQAILARLQVPYVKASLADPRLLSTPDHAARRLLERLVGWGQGWSATDIPDETQLAPLVQAVDAIVDSFAPDESVFESALAAFGDATSRTERRVETTERRQRQTAEGQEKLGQARDRVVRDLHDALDGLSIPPLVEQFCRRPWAHHMVMVLLREGESARAYRTSVDWVIGLAAHLDPNAPRTHQTPLSFLFEQMRAAQPTLGIDPHGLERFWVHVLAAIQQKPGPLVTPLPASAILGSEDTWQAAPLKKDPNPEAGSSLEGQVERWINQKEARMKPGVWWQWQQENGQVRAIKLSWVGRFNRRVLFVNNQGLRAAEWSWDEVDDRLARGELTPGQTRPVAERAFESLPREPLAPAVPAPNSTVIRSPAP